MRLSWRDRYSLAVLATLAAIGMLIAGNGCGDDTSEAAIPRSAPPVEVPDGLPPKKLVVRDLHEGTGIEAKKDDTVKIQYYGVDWDTGSAHANSWSYSRIPTFRLGEPRLLRGLYLAIPGMREGGGREVLIPHNLVYYPGGKHQPLGILDALVYKVYLVKVVKRKRGGRPK